MKETFRYKHFIGKKRKEKRGYYLWNVSLNRQEKVESWVGVEKEFALDKMAKIGGKDRCEYRPEINGS